MIYKKGTVVTWRVSGRKAEAVVWRDWRKGDDFVMVSYREELISIPLVKILSVKNK